MKRHRNLNRFYAALCLKISRLQSNTRLDAITRQTLQDDLLKLAAETRMTTVFITHDLEEAIYLGDRVHVLGANPGRVIETIEVGLSKPRNQLTTREDPKFLAHRHHLFGLMQGH